MRWFLLIFFFTYSSLHAYVFLKVDSALGLHAKGRISILFIMLFMIIAPVLVRILERAEYDTIARVIAYGGYTWMGLLILFVSAALALDSYRLSIFLVQTVFSGAAGRFQISPQALFTAALIFSAAATGYGYIEARNIRFERIQVSSPKISEEIGKVKIVQLSDVHLGLIVGERRLKTILNMVAQENPDIVVSTGDLVDAQLCGHRNYSDMIAVIRPPHGKYAVTGNHEFYAGLNHALECTQRGGFRMLRGEGISIDGVINIAGVDDPAGRRVGLYREVSEATLLSQLPKNLFTLFLKHRPEIEEKALGHFDLQLSGHTHKGQIFPFNIVTWLFYPVHAGMLNIVDTSYIYVSRGTGTWGPPLRVLSPPEVTVIELFHQKK